MWIALIVFVLAYIAIASEKFPRHWVALLGGGVLIFARVLSPSEALGYINWETLGLLAGMFLLVSILHEGGFFTWMAMASLRQGQFPSHCLFCHPDHSCGFSGDVDGQHYRDAFPRRADTSTLPLDEPGPHPADHRRGMRGEYRRRSDAGGGSPECHPGNHFGFWFWRFYHQHWTDLSIGYPDYAGSVLPDQPQKTSRGQSWH